MPRSLAKKVNTLYYLVIRSPEPSLPSTDSRTSREPPPVASQSPRRPAAGRVPARARHATRAPGSTEFQSPSGRRRRLSARLPSPRSSRGPDSRESGPLFFASLAQLDQSAGLRSRRSHVRVVHEAPDVSPIAQSGRAPGCYPGCPWFESTLGSHAFLRVAQLAERMVWDHQAAGSRPAAETAFIPPPRGGTGRRTGLRSRSRKTCPFDSDRGDHHAAGASSSGSDSWL